MRPGPRPVWSWAWWVSAPVVLVVLALLSMSVGRYPLDPVELLNGLIAEVIPGAGAHLSSVDQVVLTQIRLPRVLGAIMVGAALSGAGASYQATFQNPLVSPDILGVSAGAGFGASLGILLGLPSGDIQALAFAGGLIAVLVTVAFAQFVGRGAVVVLVLAGVVVGALAQALIAVTQYFANPTTTLPEIVFFLLGSLDSVTLGDLWLPAILAGVSILALFLLGWQINVLAAGEDEARTLGVRRGMVWGTVIVAATVMTAAVVSIVGIVGWVGLVVPHVARHIVGPSFGRLFPASIVLGAIFVLAVDTINRSASSLEFPLGVLTAVIGAPFFMALLARARKQWR